MCKLVSKLKNVIQSHSVVLKQTHNGMDVAEVHRILVQTYDDHTLSETISRNWFRCLKNNDFQIEVRSGEPKKFEQEELEALLNDSTSQKLVRLASHNSSETLCIWNHVNAKKLGVVKVEAKRRTAASPAEKERVSLSYGER